MAYRFKHGESFGDGLLRIGAEQLRRTSTALEAAPGPAEVHDTRKTIKRLRALLRLVRPGIGEADFKQLNARLRDASRLLSAARDRTVLGHTIERLALDADPADQSALASLLELVADDTTMPAAMDAESLAESRRLLAKAAQAWDKLRLDPESFAPLGAGLGTVLQDCKDAFAAAYASAAGAGDRDQLFHDWRKGVQRHWRHMQLFELAWPEYTTARVAQAKELSEILGQAQDLAVFVAFAEGLKQRSNKTVPTKTRPSKTGPGPTRKQCQHLIQLARKQQQALIEAAQPRGERLLAEGTSGHVKRIELFWSTAPAIEPLPSEPMTKPPDAPVVAVGMPAAALSARTSRKRSTKSTPRKSLARKPA